MGRHREFNTEQALDAALNVFWSKGFEGTSITDLTKATGVATPGLYAAFGNKEAFFLKVLDRYEARYLAFTQHAMQEPTARAVIETLLRLTAKMLTAKSHPAGCLGINGAIACSEEAETVQQELVRRRRASEHALCQRLKQAETRGELPAGYDAQALARLVMIISQGMAVQAKSGATQKQLNQVIDLALNLLPQPTSVAVEINGPRLPR